MPTILEEPNANGEWRSKYLETVRELDRLEGNFKDTEESLHRTIIRLTHFAPASRGQDVGEDSWQAVRDLIRKKPNAKNLEEKIKQMSDRLEATNEQPPCKETSKVLGQLVESVFRYTPDIEWELEVAEKIRALSSCSDNAYTIGELLKRVKQFFDKGGLSNEESLCILDVMESLVTKIACPEQDQPRLETFQNSIAKTKEGKLGLDLLFVELKELLTAVHGSIQTKQSDTEKFLETLVNRLADLSQFFKDVQETNDAVVKDHDALESKVMEEIHELTETMNNAVDLPSAKGSIETLLDKVQGHMRWFHEQTKKRNQKLQEETIQLKNKVKGLKTASETLKKAVISTKEAALLDPLTGIYNRRALDLYLQTEYKRWLRKPCPLSVIFTDIDHFKNINDTWGHKAGDQALKAVVKIIHRGIRQNDYFARYGGEEFVIILPDTPADAALITAEKFRQTVEQTHFHFGGKQVGLTLSCGISSLRGIDNFADCLQRADLALYKAKDSGRNRSVIDAENAA